MSEPEFKRLLPEGELAAGEMRCVELEGRAILLCRTRDGHHAVDAICTHAFARLDEGRLRGHRLICPLHGAGFDVRTGAVLGAPATVALASYPVRLRDGFVEVQLAR